MWASWIRTDEGCAGTWQRGRGWTAQEGGTVLGEVIGEAVSELEAVTAEPVGVDTSEVEEEDTIWALMARAGYMVW